MTVALLPPISAGWGRSGEPLKTGPNFLRGRQSAMWHRPRAGKIYPDNRISYWLWCGQSMYSSRSISRETVPMDMPVCGTCEGRAIGAGQVEGDTDYATQFNPRWIDPPNICPGSRTEGMFAAVGRSRNVGRCLVCGEFEAVRTMGGGGYNYGWAGLVKHAPGPGLIARCDHHGWQHVTIHNGAALCRCAVSS